MMFIISKFRYLCVIHCENMSATINYLCVIHCENISATITFVLFTVKTCLLPLINSLWKHVCYHYLCVIHCENMIVPFKWLTSWLPCAHFHPYQVIDKHWWRRSLISLNNFYAHSSEQMYVFYRAANPTFWCRGDLGIFSGSFQFFQGNFIKLWNKLPVKHIWCLYLLPSVADKKLLTWLNTEIRMNNTL
jgi:hypothetical protein